MFHQNASGPSSGALPISHYLWMCQKVPYFIHLDCLPSFTGVIPIGFLSWNLDKAELLFQTCLYLPLSFKTIYCICSPNRVPVTYVICTYDVDGHMGGGGEVTQGHGRWAVKYSMRSCREIHLNLVCINPHSLIHLSLT